jgi:peptidoglycan-associated lipoprotein
MSSRALAVCIVAAVLALGTVACKQKPPVTAADTPAATAATAPAAAPPPHGTASAAPDPFAGSLDALNEHLRREGLLGAIYFDYDSSDLSSDARDRLLASSRFLAEHPELVVQVEGHADERGTPDYNLALGEHRAAAVSGMLKSLGVAGERLQTRTYGEERPTCGDSAESCWQLNRRAELTVVARRDVG